MARRLIRDTTPLAAEIMDGKHDADLDYLLQAINARRKNMWRKGMKVRLVNTRNPQIDGKVGVITKVNQRTVSVGLGEYDAQWGIYEDGDYNVPPTMLEAVTA